MSCRRSCKTKLFWIEICQFYLHLGGRAVVSVQRIWNQQHRLYLPESWFSFAVDGFFFFKGGRIFISRPDSTCASATCGLRVVSQICWVGSKDISASWSSTSRGVMITLWSTFITVGALDSFTNRSIWVNQTHGVCNGLKITLVLIKATFIVTVYSISFQIAITYACIGYGSRILSLDWIHPMFEEGRHVARKRHCTRWRTWTRRRLPSLLRVCLDLYWGAKERIATWR